jgi:Spy/CpxP family protein refolding chaperone
MRSIIAALSILALLGVGLSSLNTAFAQAQCEQQSCPTCPEKKAEMQNPGMMGGPGMPAEKPGMMMEKMEFTSEQQKTMHKMKMKLHKEIAPLRTDLETKEMELQELWMAETPDLEQIVKKVSEINKIQWQIQEKQIRHQFDIYKILKPEQQKMFRARHMMGMGPKGQMGPMRCPMGGMGGCQCQ